MTEVINTTPKPRSGPHWRRDWQVGFAQEDDAGEQWIVTRVENHGRVLHWESCADGRPARTEAVPAHPDYITDEELIERAREAKREAKAKRSYP